MEQLNKDGNIVQSILICEDLEDFKKVSSMVCTLFPESMMQHIYYSSEGAIKSAAYDLHSSLVRITSVKDGEDGKKCWARLPPSMHILSFKERLWEEKRRLH